jgi:hypothetical protein
MIRRAKEPWTGRRDRERKEEEEMIIREERVRAGVARRGGGIMVIFILRKATPGIRGTVVQ